MWGDSIFLLGGGQEKSGATSRRPRVNTQGRASLADRAGNRWGGVGLAIIRIGFRNPWEGENKWITWMFRGYAGGERRTISGRPHADVSSSTFVA